MIDSYVTGGSGFIGKHLLRRLHGVTLTIPHGHIKEAKFDQAKQFFFLSTYGNMAHHTDLMKIYQANAFDLETVLEASERFEWLLYMSTSSVRLKVHTAYSTSKMTGELLLNNFKVPSCVVRPYSVIGVGEQKEHLIPTLIRSCITGEQMDFVPDATHDFIDVDDLIDGVIMLSNRKATGVFEFGRGLAIPNSVIKDMVEDVMGCKANTKMVYEMRPFDNKNWCCEQPCKGWSPKKTLRQSIEEMVAAYVD